MEDEHLSTTAETKVSTSTRLWRASLIAAVVFTISFFADCEAYRDKLHRVERRPGQSLFEFAIHHPLTGLLFTCAFSSILVFVYALVAMQAGSPRWIWGGPIPTLIVLLGTIVMTVLLGVLHMPPWWVD